MVIGYLAATAPVRADPATAREAFAQAEMLRGQGKWSDACPLYAASYKEDPQLGVLLHLAECHEKIGRLATAWSEFNDAAELAHARKDPREASARGEADALAPRVAKLHIQRPPGAPPGLVIRLDGTDVTVLVANDLPVDPGDHAITASAPGYTDATAKITVTGEGKIVPLALPALAKAVAPPPPPPPAVHESTIEVTSQPDAHILLDSAEVGVGHYRGKVKTGGHQLRVTAPGMHPYQSEIVVGEDENRRIDVPLEKEVAAVTSAAAAPEAPTPLWGGMIVLAGLGTAGLSSNPTTGRNTMPPDPNLPAGNGPRGQLGPRIGARARIQLTGSFAIEPGIFYEYKRVYMEFCEPCREIEEVDIHEIELPVLARFAAVRARGWGLGIYAGPYVALRLGTSDGHMVVETLVSNPAKDDVGVELGIDLHVHRVEAQLGAQLGTSNVSTEANAPIETFGFAVGARI